MKKRLRRLVLALAIFLGTIPIQASEIENVNDADIPWYEWYREDLVNIEFVGENAIKDTLPVRMNIYPNAHDEFIFTIPHVPSPSGKGYEFQGYQLIFIDDDDEKKVFENRYYPGDKVTLKKPGHYQLNAIFEKIVVSTITLTYHANGGEDAPEPKTLSTTKSKVMFDISNKKPIRPGYKFLNWNTEADGSGTSYKKKAIMVTASDVQLYAQWKQIDTGNRISADVDEIDQDEDMNNHGFLSFLDNTTIKKVLIIILSMTSLALLLIIIHLKRNPK